MVKRVLITGLNSYVGTEFKKFVENLYYESIIVNTISVKGDDWLNHDFSKYDVIFHVAGIVHSKKHDKSTYFKVNSELSESIAKKAKINGVGQFIYMSTFSVYGKNHGNLNKSSTCSPKDSYGLSKYEGELKLQKLEDEKFKIVIVRSPMIYGPNSPGNYSTLRKFAVRTPIFIQSNNVRSMIFIGVLNNFIAQIIINEEQGVFVPQNIEFVQVSQMIKYISLFNNNKIYFIYIPKIIFDFSMRFKIFQKIFGELKYESSLNEQKYIINMSLEESIKITESY